MSTESEQQAEDVNQTESKGPSQSKHNSDVNNAVLTQISHDDNDDEYITRNDNEDAAAAATDGDDDDDDVKTLTSPRGSELCCLNVDQLIETSHSSNQLQSKPTTTCQSIFFCVSSPDIRPVEIRLVGGGPSCQIWQFCVK